VGTGASVSTLVGAGTSEVSSQASGAVLFSLAAPAEDLACGNPVARSMFSDPLVLAHGKPAASFPTRKLRSNHIRLHHSEIHFQRALPRPPKRSAFARPLVSLFVLLVAVQLLQFAVHAVDWEIEVIDSRSSVGWETSIDVDSQGNPHACYTEWASTLWYAYRDPALGWQYESLGPSYLNYCSIELDSRDRPHVVYCTGAYSSWALVHAVKEAGGWQFETVDSGWVGIYSDIALDNEGWPHISYQDYENQDLKYAWKDAAGWHVEVVASEGKVGQSTSIVVDSSGWPHISYVDRGNYDVRYAYKDELGWHLEEFPFACYSVWNDTSIALDSLQRPHITYFEGRYLGSLNYTWHIGSGQWPLEEVDFEGWQSYVGVESSLALDTADLPRVAYCKGRSDSDNDLRFAFSDGASWFVTTVVSEGKVGRSPSLALDRDDTPHISYFDQTNEQAMYAVLDIPSAPSDLVATAQSSESIDLAWQDHSNAEAVYVVERSSGGAFSEIVALNPDVTSFSDSDLQASRNYCYRVRARNVVGYSEYSNIDCATTHTGADIDPPSPDPMRWDVEPHAVGANRIEMTACTAIDPSAVEYRFVETSGNPGCSSSSWQDSPTYIDDGLGSCARCCYEVVARDKSPNQNETQPSSAICVTTDGLKPTAAFSFAPDCILVDEIVDFTDASTDDGTITSWLWNFGDGSSSNVQNPNHSFGAAGEYTVALTATDNTGLDDSTPAALHIFLCGDLDGDDEVTVVDVLMLYRYVNDLLPLDPCQVKRADMDQDGDVDEDDARALAGIVFGLG